MAGSRPRPACCGWKHRSLLEACFQYFGRRAEGDSDQSRTCACAARAEDRRQRRGMVGGLVAPWFVAAQFYSPAGNSRVAGTDALSRERSTRAVLGCQSHPETVGEWQPQTGTGGQRCVGSQRPDDPEGFGQRRKRPAEIGGLGAGQTQREESLFGASAAGTFDGEPTLCVGRVVEPWGTAGSC